MYFFVVLTTVVGSWCVGAVHNCRLASNNCSSHRQGELELPYGNHAIIILKSIGVFCVFIF